MHSEKPPVAETITPDAVAVLREALARARKLSLCDDAHSSPTEQTAWSAVNAALQAVERDLGVLRTALGEVAARLPRIRAPALGERPSGHAQGWAQPRHGADV